VKVERLALLYVNQPVTFELAPGKLNLLVGKNGAGKTTVLRAILREPVVQSGTIDFPEPRHLAYLPQEPIFPEHLKVRDLLKLAFLNQTDLFGKVPAEASHKIETELEAMGLQALAHRPLGQLSSGERQKAFFARTLLQPAKALILDEPTNHLDPEITDALWERLAAMAKAGLPILASTHDREIIRSPHIQKIEIV